MDFLMLWQLGGRYCLSVISNNFGFKWSLNNFTISACESVGGSFRVHKFFNNLFVAYPIRLKTAGALLILFY